MIKAKLLALCVCPAIAAPPAILAVHAPARHAVAHLLHRAAARFDNSAPAAKPAPASPAMAALPCAPSLNGAGGGLPITGGDLIGGGGDLTVASPAEGGGISTDGGFGGSGGGGFGGGSGGGGSNGGGSFGGGSSGGGSTGGGSTGGGGNSTGTITSGGGGGSAGGVPITGGGIAISTPAGALPGLGVPIAGPLPVPISSASPISGTPEPATWAFLIVGFGLVGVSARCDRPAPAGIGLS